MSGSAGRADTQHARLTLLARVGRDYRGSDGTAASVAVLQRVWWRCGEMCGAAAGVAVLQRVLVALQKDAWCYRECDGATTSLCGAAARSVAAHCALMTRIFR